MGLLVLGYWPAGVRRSLAPSSAGRVRIRSLTSTGVLLCCMGLGFLALPASYRSSLGRRLGALLARSLRAGVSCSLVSVASWASHGVLALLSLACWDPRGPLASVARPLSPTAPSLCATRLAGEINVSDDLPHDDSAIDAEKDFCDSSLGMHRILYPLRHLAYMTKVSRDSFPFLHYIT